MIDIYPLDLSTRELVNKYLAGYPPKVSELTFTNLFAWRHSRPVWFAQIKDSLVFLIAASSAPGGPKILFGPPVGPATVAEALSSLGINHAVRLIEETTLTLKPKNFTITADRDNADYIYLVSDLAGLAGRKYVKKRNHVNQCLKKYDCVYEEITPTNLEECRDMLDRWCQSRQCEVEPGLCGEYKAINETFNYCRKFNLIGGAIRIADRIEAFAIGERLNNDTAVWHFEKAMADFQGLSQLINQWFAHYGLADFKFVNREQDLGIPGLRQAKESYHPHHLLEKYSICPVGSKTPCPDIAHHPC
ncbi:MAG: DUF2156 domain-containing protein [Proteobacteria bacterium]|nr:DUF2156 domain-containing protein [Pseudomonadota bacterium]MBU1715930.1 DUF2156 domain-containing protein [Pseudomonadota bacterium]